MNIQLELIVDYIKLFIINICVYYCFAKIVNINKNRFRNNTILVVASIILLAIYIQIKSIVGYFLPLMMMCLAYGTIISKITNNKWGYSIIITIISYAILFVFNTLSVIIQFIPYKLFYTILGKENILLSFVIITIIQLFLVYIFFKIKRFSTGITFLKAKLNNEITDIIMFNISTIVMTIYCLFEVGQDDFTKKLFVIIIFLGIIMFFTIQKMLTMYYKQKLLMDTMEEYKKEIIEKQSEIDKLKNDKQSISKITHDFYNRQKALELLVTSNMNLNNIDKESISPSVLKIIEELTSEYSQRFESVKELPKLPKTEIMEIDNMFSYMQSECSKNNIDFKLKVTGNIHSLINNIILKNKLETLIGDHLRDAINAVNLEEVEYKEILAVIGTKNNKYEFSVFDTGIDFKIDTLLKLGIKPTTTNKERGGTGTGFMTTFDTLKETKASLIITEYPKGSNGHYTKCVTIRFDGKCQYKICSYREQDIKDKAKDSRIKIEKLK